MGQEISQSYTPPPLTLRDCIIDGQIDLARYRLYARRVYENEYEHSRITNAKKFMMMKLNLKQRN